MDKLACGFMHFHNGNSYSAVVIAKLEHVWKSCEWIMFVWVMFLSITSQGLIGSNIPNLLLFSPVYIYRTNDLLAMQASRISSSFFLSVLILNYVVHMTTAVRPPFLLMWLLALWTISLGTDCACQLSSRHVWKTWERSTHSFHRVQQGAIAIAIAAMDILRITIDTDELSWMPVSMILSHQIAMILFGPSRWTVIPCGHH